MVFTIPTDVSVILQCLFAAMAWAVMGARLWLRKHRCRRFDAGDYMTMLCMLTLLLSLIMISVYQKFKVRSLLQKPGGLTPHDLAIAKRLTRVYVGYTYVYIIYLWGQKSVVLLFIQRIWGGLPWPHIWILVAWGYLALTFSFAIIGWSVSCTGPVHNIVLTGHPPVNCLNSKGSLYSYVAQNTSSDLLLIILPIPWLLQVHRPWSQRLLLIGLFSLGLLVAAASLARAFLSSTNQGINVIITLFEVLLSALAANLPTLYSLRRRKQAPAPSTLDPECSMPQPQPQHLPHPHLRARALTDTEIIADSGDTDTDAQSDHRNTRVSSQASTEPLFRRELNL
ncbi:hypothetical protein BO99DRAFT_434581 [Aspergillus violaceofuscus CBS 115571]|uniref:Rhodopsin domain-containing protein n=1 Tax=Aspergillus violaceofuscus (strain CBS 115571) TaxID=1450538 RepID=A0A2V5HZQ8_ASPV1|nr:hypothetical protein BO99DRAFT_434581 [Aspergillus violaceofuscus CBS 115571]